MTKKEQIEALIQTAKNRINLLNGYKEYLYLTPTPLDFSQFINLHQYLEDLDYCIICEYQEKQNGYEGRCKDCIVGSCLPLSFYSSYTLMLRYQSWDTPWIQKIENLLNNRLKYWLNKYEELKNE